NPSSAVWTAPAWRGQASGPNASARSVPRASAALLPTHGNAGSATRRRKRLQRSNRVAEAGARMLGAALSISGVMAQSIANPVGHPAAVQVKRSERMSPQAAPRPWLATDHRVAGRTQRVQRVALLHRRVLHLLEARLRHR